MPKIDRLLAYVMADKDEDDEGIPGIAGPNGGVIPMVGADEKRILSLRDHAQAIADRFGKPVKVLRFTQVELIETIEPRGPDKAPGSN